MDTYELQPHYIKVLESGADIIFGPLCLCDINRHVHSRYGYQLHCNRVINHKEYSKIFEKSDDAVREFFKLKNIITKK